ncbi:helix-turn-helix transcriptional regulator [Thiorhodovibrio winogradskyi]|nr:WYL domain-containing protein [Thiorhodovibrio winogradskyi]
MSATHQERIERLQALFARISPPQTAPQRCVDVGRLERLLEDEYGTEASAAARRRRLQRDLTELIRDERIVAVNPGGKPLRYRRRAEAGDDDPNVIAYTRQLIDQTVTDLVPKGRLEALWRQLVVSDQVPALNDQRLRILSAEQRLIPAKVHPRILSTVITGVAEQRILSVKYRKATGQLRKPRLHPQALVQRGPVIYLVALKNNEPAHVRFYALHRMVRVELTEDAARAAAGFDLDRAIAEGLVDFGCGETIALELRVRGYLTDVLEACPLAEGQQTLPEPEDSDFDLRLHATVPSSGALLRWLLAAGDNLEVVAPDAMRRNVAAQINKASTLYANVL